MIQFYNSPWELRPYPPVGLAALVHEHTEKHADAYAMAAVEGNPPRLPPVRISAAARRWWKVDTLPKHLPGAISVASK